MCEITVHKFTNHSPEVIDIEDFNIDCRVKGFCEPTMTLLFKSHPLFNPTLLPPGEHPESASTEMALTYSLAFKRHVPPVSYVTSEMLSRLYHVVDNPTVEYNELTKQYYEAQMYYIDRETMTGIIVGNVNDTSDRHPVHGIFAPRGYEKIECYNQFHQMYLVDSSE